MVVTRSSVKLLSIVRLMRPLCLVALLFSHNINAFAASVEVHPAQDTVFIGKKPGISAIFDTTLDASTVYVLLDNRDVTELVQITDLTVAYKPPVPVRGGWHEVIIGGNFQDGGPIDLIWSFRVKHTEQFDEVGLEADVNTVYQSALDGKEADVFLPEWKFQLTGNTRFKLIRENKAISLEGTAFYFKEDGSLTDDQEGGDYRNFCLTGTWTGSKGTGELKVGDLSISETSFVTPGLARRGLQISYKTGQSEVGIYSLGNTPVFGIRDGLNINLDPDESIQGGSFRWADKAGKTRIHASYMIGTEDLGGSYSSSGPGLVNEGEVLGFAVDRTFGSGKLTGYLEGALSNYNPDTNDSHDVTQDQAVSTGATWRASDRLDFSFQYQRIGKDFTSIGNTGGIKDLHNASLGSGIHLDKHNVNLLLYAAQDNLENDTTIPGSKILRVEASERYTISQNLVAGLRVFNESLDNEIVPVGYVREEKSTNHVAADLSFSRATWSLRPYFSTTAIDVKSGLGSDLKQEVYRLDLSVFTSPRFNLMLTLPQYSAKYIHGGIDTGILFGSFQLGIQPFGDDLQFDLTGSYSDTETSDNSLDSTVMDFTGRLSYKFKKSFPDYAAPQLSLEGGYRKTRDRVFDVDQEEFVIYLNFELLSTIRL